MFSSLTLAVALVLASLMTMSILDRLTNEEGNLLQQSQTDQCLKKLVLLV